MDTKDRRGIASLACVVGFLVLIFLGAFLSKPAMAQLTVTNSSNNEPLFFVTPDANLGQRLHGYIVTDGLALSGDNQNRGAIWFATPGDWNLALYNNHSNIDGENNVTDGWDGTKWNVLAGLNIRVGSGPPYPSAMYIEGEGDFKGSVGIGTTSPQGALDVSSTKGGFIVPRMSTLERDAPTFTAVNGMIIYNTTTNKFNFYEDGAWVTKANNP